MQLIISRQGELVKIKPITNRVQFQRTYERGDREVTTEFTARSRKNLLEHFAIIDKEKARSSKFVTLTYASIQRDDQQAYKHLRAFLRRIEREAERELEQGQVANVRGENMFFLWRKEDQERESIHFHLMIWNCKWLSKDWLAYEWSDVIGETVEATCSDGDIEYMPVFTRVEECKNERKTWYYLSKYMAKTDSEKHKNESVQFIREQAHSIRQPASDVTLPKHYAMWQPRAYCWPNQVERERLASEEKMLGLTSRQIRTEASAASGIADLSRDFLEPDVPEKPKKSRGRFWGWERRQYIPLAEKIVAEFTCTWEEYRRFRWDMGQVQGWVRDVHLAHTLKMFWFEDIIEPVTMFIQSINGDMVFGWKTRLQC